MVQKNVRMSEIDAITSLTHQIVFMKNMRNTHFKNMNLGQSEQK